MLSVQELGSGDQTIFFLHWLSGSGTAWARVASLLQPRFRCVLIDLPGFGASAGIPGYSVAEMIASVAEVIASDQQRHPGHWSIAGHSMGAKVALGLARRAEDGLEAFAAPVAIITAAGSPPSPEPMSEKRRETMKSWFVSGEAQTRKEAADFIDANSAQPLPSPIREAAIADVLRMNRDAWVAWLAAGSREDWISRVGVLRTPALILAGEKDEELRADVQRALMMPHFASSDFYEVEGAKHLLPLEQPELVAALIEARLTSVPLTPAALRSPTGISIPTPYAAFLASDRVSDATRNVLSHRAAPDDPAYSPRVLNVIELAILRAVLDRVLPQQENSRIDLAARLDTQLAASQGDGWRYATLPPDAEAWSRGLRTLDHTARHVDDRPFVSLPANQQDDLLARCAQGKLSPGLLERATHLLGIHREDDSQHLLSAEQMKLWFEDLRGEAVKLYVSHPATLARMGYSGIGDGADTATMPGFVHIGLGERESWEPLPTEKVSA